MRRSRSPDTFNMNRGEISKTGRTAKTFPLTDQSPCRIRRRRSLDPDHVSCDERHAVSDVIAHCSNEFAPSVVDAVRRESACPRQSAAALRECAPMTPVRMNVAAA